jgi:DNA-binding transcriptional regulator GbsR (MarR family)
VPRTPFDKPDKSAAAGSSPGGDRLSAKVRQVCEAVGDFIEYWGFKAIHGRIWTLLTLRHEPMSQVEIADFLQVSRSLVSGAVAELVQHGLVRPLSDHRNAPYEAVVDIWPTISDVLRDREWMLIETARLALEGAVEELELARSADYDLDRTRFLLSMTEMAQAFLRLLIGIRVPRKLEGLGDWLKNSSNFIRKLRELE